jgi:Spx/MgsR family transcriptional regulator
MIVLHGIPNCDTVKKARAWLDHHGIAYRFHDFKKQGIEADALARWAAQVGWEKLLNRQGTTWRKLEPAEQARVVDAPSAIALMQANTSVIKRPVIERGKEVIVGFEAERYAALK